MANMHYCRYQNTLQDLREIYDSEDYYDESELSDDERMARKRLFRLCAKIASDFDETE